jgi:membrane fusion protein (multidrug efflux system)
MKKLALCLLAAGVLTACGGEKEAEVSTVVAEETAALPVHVATLEATDFSDTLSLFGRVEAKESVRIAAEIPGRIEALPFDEGQAVGKGQTVARINARIATAQVAQAQAGADLAVATFERTQRMHEKKLAARAELDMAKAQAEQAKAGLELAQANLEKAVIRAPFAGVVTSVRATKGELANPGVPLLQVVQLSEVKVIADVPERDVPHLSVGGRVNMTLEAFPGRHFEGTISEVGLVANKTTRTFPVEILVDNTDGQLRPGMLARVQLVRSQLSNVVVVPRDAVLDQLDGKTIYVEQGGKALRRPVQLGAVRGRFAVVASGAAAGDKLIILGHRQAVDGQSVSVKKTFACCATQAGTPALPAPGGDADKAPTDDDDDDGDGDDGDDGDDGQAG